MPGVSRILLCAAISLAIGCTKKTSSGKNADPLQGVWVREGDSPGMQHADTMNFTFSNGKKILSFYSAGSPAPNWPLHTETEYRFENGKLSYRNYFDADTSFFEVESFQWIAPEQAFSANFISSFDIFPPITG